MQRCHLRGRGSTELHLEHVGEELVIAKPEPPAIQGGQERVGILELVQHAFGAFAAGEKIGQRTTHTLEHRGAQQHLAHFRRLAIQDLRQQIRRHVSLAAREFGDEAPRVRMVRERNGDQPQPGNPPFRAVIEPRHGAIGQSDALRRSSSSVSSIEKRRSPARSSVSWPDRRRR